VNKLLLFLCLLGSSFSVQVLIEDIKSFYTEETFFDLFIGFSVAGVMANTPIDQKIANYYQDHIRSKETDELSAIFKKFGGNKELAIVFGTGLTVGYLLEDTKIGDFVFDLSANVARSIIVGLPIMLFGQVLTGADRPCSGNGSAWHPFQNDHGVSGHAYMGAVPFLATAYMFNSPLIKIPLYFGSTLTGLSRINDNKHYTSQVLLGWLVAWTACVAVNNTNLRLEISQDRVSLGAFF